MVLEFIAEITIFPNKFSMPKHSFRYPDPGLLDPLFLLYKIEPARPLMVAKLNSKKHYSYEKKYKKKNYFFASLKSLRKESDPDPDTSVRGTDPGIRIRIRTKMSWIPNTA